MFFYTQEPTNRQEMAARMKDAASKMPKVPPAAGGAAFMAIAGAYGLYHSIYQVEAGECVFS